MSTTHAVNPRTVLLEPLQGRDGRTIWEVYRWDPKTKDFGTLPEAAFVSKRQAQAEYADDEVWD